MRLMIFGMLALAGIMCNGPSALANPHIMLVAIGGNSECRNEHEPGGIKTDLYKPGRLRSAFVGLGVSPTNYVERYYSWTGDPYRHPGCLPGNIDYLRGSAHIRRHWPELTTAGRDTKIVLVGWSNGGATAYELACDLALMQRPVSLLITLDPVSRTTQPCFDGAGRPVKPAKTWISVYTASAPDAKFKASNIIAFVGGAWNDAFPSPPAIGPNSRYLLQPANHSDVLKMWCRKVVGTGQLEAWRARELGTPGSASPSRTVAC